MKIDRVDVHRLEIPLERPYRLAFGPVTHYDTIVITITGSDGRVGHGEATLLTGYTDETIDAGHALACDVARQLPGTESGNAAARFVSLGGEARFVATAFQTALDMALGHPLLSPSAGTRVPILGLLQRSDRGELQDDFERLRADGYRTVKVKVGFDVARDLRAMETIQRVVDGRVPIRVDANQGYSAAEAVEFVRAVDPGGIELFEQPCKAGDWDANRAAVAAAATTGLPLMLDESIYGLDDIERAARGGACRFVKVKLMKFVGIDALVGAIERIRTLGMRPVLGNGVEGRGRLGPLVVAPGGATTDVHSIGAGEPARPGVIRYGLPEPHAKRTVEGDLGMRPNAASIVAAVGLDKLAANAGIAVAVAGSALSRIESNVEMLPTTDIELKLDDALVRAAVDIAVRRHAGTVETVYTAHGPVQLQRGKDLSVIGWLMGTGGAVVHARDPASILAVACADAAQSGSLRPRAPCLEVLEMGDGDVAVGTVRAFAAGVLDVPWSPNRHVRSRVMPARDADGYLRILDPAGLPLPPAVMEVHEAGLRARAAKERVPFGRDLAVQSVYELSESLDHLIPDRLGAPVRAIS